MNRNVTVESNHLLLICERFWDSSSL